jgi:predicted aspartyl protease
MKRIQEVLQKKKYKKIPFVISKTQHLILKARINGCKGVFILDTGASNSCVGLESVEKFELNATHSSTKAAGAGAVNMTTQLASDNLLQLGRWKATNFSFIVFDLTHVNQALKQYKTKAVDGIIGADVLLEGKAIIDYHHQYLYLL